MKKNETKLQCLKRVSGEVIKNPFLIVSKLAGTPLVNWIPDKWYIKICYRAHIGKRLNLDNPQTFNEKLQWLKLYNRKPEYSLLVDKYEVKKYVADKVGEEYVIPTLGVWKTFDEIDFDKLPEQFVLKCTHDSGGLIICRDKSQLDLIKAKEKITKSLKRNYYLTEREWFYKNVEPRIIAEQYMEDESSRELEDDKKILNVYKIFCFSGEPKLFQVIQNDKSEFETIDYFDTAWNKLKLRQNFPNSETPLPKPERLDEMVEVASKLSREIAFVRVDLYEINKKVYFSEMTFFSDAGFAKFEPEEWDEKLGGWLELK